MSKAKADIKHGKSRITLVGGAKFVLAALALALVALLALLRTPTEQLLLYLPVLLIVLLPLVFFIYKQELIALLLRGE